MNIFWILTDSILNYENESVHSMLPCYKELKKEGFLFTNARSLFPSTYASVISIMTGCEPYRILPDFYNTLPHNLPNYISQLAKNRFSVKSIICWKAGGGWFNTLNPVHREWFYKGDKQLEASEIVRVFQEEIKKLNREENNLFYVHFRAGDAEMNKGVEEVVKTIKKTELWDDSIILINSDHGYYDNERYKKPKFLHFDDVHESSLSPIVFLKLPGSLSKKKPREVKERIYLIDLWETLFDYLGLKASHKRQAKSFRALVEESGVAKKDRIIRADAYLLFQPIKKTAIYQDDWKLLITNEEEKLVNTALDPLEEKNLITKEPRVYKRLRQHYQQSEAEATSGAEQLLKTFFKKSKLSALRKKKVIIPERQFPPAIINFLKRELKKNNTLAGNKADYLILIYNRLTGYGISKLKQEYKGAYKKLILIDTKLNIIEENLPLNYCSFVLKNLADRRKVLLQRWKDVAVWVFYFPLYFNKHLKKHYH